MNLHDEQREKLQILFRAIADVVDLALREARGRQPPAPPDPMPRQGQRPSPARALDHDRLWDVGDVAKYLQASRSWVYKATEEGTLPCLRLGAMLRFEPDAVIRSIGLDVPLKPHPATSKAVVHPRRVPMGFAAPPAQVARPADAMPYPGFAQQPTPTLKQMSAQSPHSGASTAAPRPPAVGDRPFESLLSARQAAERLGVCTATLYKLCDTGELRHTRVLNYIKVKPEDLERLRVSRTKGRKGANPDDASATSSSASR